MIKFIKVIKLHNDAQEIAKTYVISDFDLIPYIDVYIII